MIVQLFIVGKVVVQIVASLLKFSRNASKSDFHYGHYICITHTQRHPHLCITSVTNSHSFYLFFPGGRHLMQLLLWIFVLRRFSSSLLSLSPWFACFLSRCVFASPIYVNDSLQCCMWPALFPGIYGGSMVVWLRLTWSCSLFLLVISSLPMFFNLCCHKCILLFSIVTLCGGGIFLCFFSCGSLHFFPQ